MAVTKQTYTASATWTFPQFFNLFRSAFIDAGLMTEWYDSFLSGSVENRILEVTYDGTKTYGKTYYWFQYSSINSRWIVTLATGWNAVTHVPTGTQYLDFFSSSTSSEAGPTIQSGMNTGLTVSIDRFTSQVDNTHSWFRVKNGSNYKVFSIARPEHTVASWIDLNKTFFHHFVELYPYTSILAGGITFFSRGNTRRSYGNGTALNGETNRRDLVYQQASYAIPGRASNNYTNNIGTLSSPSLGSNVNSSSFGIILPNGLTAANPAYSTNYNPVYTGLPYSFYMTNSNLPSDIGIIAHYANNNLAPEDTFVVTAGVEEWEILQAANNSTAITGASVAFAVRVV
jgi:hypothetical protein